MLTEFQKAKLAEWAEWVEIMPNDGLMPVGLKMVNDWAFITTLQYPSVSFPTREQFAERQNAATSEAI